MTKKHWFIIAAVVLVFGGIGMVLAFALGFFAGHEEATGSDPSLPVYTMGQQSPSSHPGYLHDTVTGGGEVYVHDYEEACLQLTVTEPQTVIGLMGSISPAKVGAIPGQPVTAYIMADCGSEMPAYVPYRNIKQPPFDWRTAKSNVWLNPAVPWDVSLKGGMWQLSADFRGLELRSLEVGGGASDVQIWLPAPAGVVPVRISGGASHVRLHRPAGSALRAEVTGGASQLVFDRQSLGSFGGRNRLETPGFAAASDRYEVRLSGGASQLDIDQV